jgi:hypothetical protein
MLQPSAISPTGIIPESLLYPRKLGEVMALLQSLPVTGEEKLAAFLGYARTVGVSVNASQRNAVLQSGTDYEGPIPETQAQGGAP